ncbi:MAG: hypothetical protein QOF58_2353 [Pseudonocardiales bacterium]|nr:hypothetical protein [Pseudonocardiales bacterium]
MSERLRGVVDQLAIRPDDRVLEISCGQGVAATMVCQLLSTGTLTAIDRSTRMVEAATRRNLVYVASGKAEFLIASLEDVNLGDLVFAVRVGLFQRDPDSAHSLLAPWLAPDARVRTFYDVPV